MVKYLLALCMVVWAVHGYAAIDPHEFSSPEARERYHYFTNNLRCPKCKNTNLAGTNSEIANDLRRELRHLIEDGKTDQEITDFMVTRYGDYILYRPRLTSNTIALWMGPVVFLAIGLTVVGTIVWRRRRKGPNDKNTLTEEEQSELAKMFAERDSSAKTTK